LGTELSILRFPDRLDRLPDRPRTRPVSRERNGIALREIELTPEPYREQDEHQSFCIQDYRCLELDPINPAPARYAITAYTSASQVSTRTFERGTRLSVSV
jgi:hypothetical protein